MIDLEVGALVIHSNHIHSISPTVGVVLEFFEKWSSPTKNVAIVRWGNGETTQTWTRYLVDLGQYEH